MYIILLIFALAGCATTKPREPSKASFSTKGTDQAILKNLTRALAANGFLIKSAHTDLGIIYTEPKEFTITRGLSNVPWPATAEVQVARQINCRCSNNI